MTVKVIGVMLLALIAAGGVGWMTGASGRSLVELERRRADMRAEFGDARAEVLDGRVGLFEARYGDAIQHFQNARNRIGQLQRQLREIGQPEQAGRLEIAASHLSDAQHRAGAFDARAQDAAAEALKALLAAGGGS